MDWTGGVRRRYVRSSANSTLQKQKAHFARARATLQDPKASRHPPRPDSLSRVSQPSRISHSRRRTDPHTLAAHSDLLRDERFPRDPVLATEIVCRRDSGQGIERPEEQIAHSRAPSIVYIRSSSVSSSPSSSRSNQKNQQRCQQPRESQLRAGAKSSVNEEEQLLLANRRRALARHSRLGLTARRPAQMCFGSARDKDRIGKRRRIERTASNADGKAKLRSISSFHGDLHLAHNRMFLRTQCAEDVKIKIGTDALKSQTEASRLSHTPDRLTLGRPSTGLTMLSEEPMLLGFEEDRTPFIDLVNECETDARPIVPDARSLMCFAGSQITTETQRFQERGSTDILADTPGLSMQQQQPGYGGGSAGAMHLTNTKMDMEDIAITENLDAHDQHDTEPSRPSLDAARHAQFDEPEFLDNVQLEESETPRHDCDIDDYDYHRRILHIGPRHFSHGSPTAVQSFGWHTTKLDTKLEPSTVDTSMNASNKDSVGESLLRSPELISSELAHAVLRDASECSSRGLQSPSTSFKAIERLANQSPAPMLPGAAVPEEDELWRQYIIGSCDGSQNSDSGHVRGLDISDEDTLIPDSLHLSSAFSVSGLGTSMKGTNGQANSITGNAPSNELDRPSTDLCDEVSEAGDMSMVCNISTSLISHYSNDAGLTEEVEQSQLGDEGDASNFHASVPKVLNPKRFMTGKRNLMPQAKNSSRFLRPQNVKGRASAKRFSVYDVPGSE